MCRRSLAVWLVGDVKAAVGRCLGRCRESASSAVDGGTDQCAWSSGGVGLRDWISGESG
jgi:hypothetical protein